MNQDIIVVNALSRRFGKVLAVNNLDLQVPQGSVYGFLGPNGAGKTTTIRMLLGLLRPHSGEINLLGQSLRRNRTALLSRIGALVEEPSLYPHLSGRQNLEVTRRLLGGSKARLEEVLRTVHLQDAADRSVSGYSQGMRQRLGLALALLNEPQLLILDEPTNGLDPTGIREMRELISALPKTHGATVFLSTHLLSEVEQMATHIGIIGQGHMLFQGLLQDLQTRLKEHIVLGVSDPAKAYTHLKKLGWSVQPGSNGYLLVAQGGKRAALQLNQQLYSAGIGVYRLALEKPRLEDVFLKLTNGNSAGN